MVHGNVYKIGNISKEDVVLHRFYINFANIR